MVDPEHIIFTFLLFLHTTFFNPVQCDAIVKQCVEELWMSGETIGGGVNKKVRNVEQQVMPIDQKGWPLTRILDLAKQANNARFKFDVAGFSGDNTVLRKNFVHGSRTNLQKTSRNFVRSFAKNFANDVFPRSRPCVSAPAASRLRGGFWNNPGFLGPEHLNSTG